MAELGLTSEYESSPIIFRDLLVDMQPLAVDADVVGGKGAEFVHAYFQKTWQRVNSEDASIPWLGEAITPEMRTAERLRLDAFGEEIARATRRFQDAHIPVIFSVEPDLPDSFATIRTPDVYTRAVARLQAMLESSGYAAKPGDLPLNIVVTHRADPAPLPLDKGRKVFADDNEQREYLATARREYARRLKEEAHIQALWVAGTNVGGEDFGPTYPASGRRIAEDPLASAARARREGQTAGRPHPQALIGARLEGCVAALARATEGVGISTYFTQFTYPQRMPRYSELTFTNEGVVAPRI